MVLAIALSACGGVKMTLINAEQAKPNNVWVFFAVNKKNGDPVGGLKASDFEIYEDGGLVSPFESKQVIQNPEVAAVMYTLLLLDVSGSMTESGKINELVNAAELFTEQVSKTQKVGVYAFDGSKNIHPIVPFTAASGSVQGGLEGLREYRAKDPSTNLHGAIVQGLRTLKKGLAREKKPLKFGTLVVFSDGADRAARVSREEMLDEIKKEEYDFYELFAIGIGDKDELKGAKLKQIGRDGTRVSEDSEKIRELFEDVATTIENHTKRFYLLSYCTPARAGTHEVRVRVAPEGKKKRGKLRHEFDAEGFGPPPQCDPERLPRFKLDDVEPMSDNDSRG